MALFTIFKSKFKALIWCSAYLAFTLTAFAESPIILKIASIAPEDSQWGEIYRMFKKEVEERSQGRLKIIHYPGGVMGDEPNIVRKMKLNQLQGAALTEFGLTSIIPQVRLLNLVLFYRNYGEWDYIRERLFNEFAAIAEKNNFILIGWTEVGGVRFFSKYKLDTFDAFKKARVWVWSGDPFAEIMAREGLGVTPVILNITEVLPGLQTGMVDTFYCPPYAALGLQWYREAKYVSQMIAGYTSGGIVLTKRIYNMLPPDLRNIIKEAWQKYFPILRDSVRELNQKTYEQFIKSGLKPVNFRRKEDFLELQKRSEELNRRIAKMIKGEKLYQEIVTLLNEYRQRKEHTSNTQ